jgi:predicted RNase H-like HicB family nuclease
VLHDAAHCGILSLLCKPTARTYSLTIEPHEGGYLASFQEMPGCNTWGATYEDEVKHAEEALAVYLETRAEHGDTIPEEDGVAPISLGVTVRTSTIA